MQIVQIPCTLALIIKYFIIIQNTVISKKDVREGKGQRKNDISLSFLMPSENTFLRTLFPKKKKEK